MKKKIIALAVVVVLICGVVAGWLLGCDLLSLHTAKRNKQAVSHPHTHRVAYYSL